jgi:hypothetical protein
VSGSGSADTGNEGGPNLPAWRRFLPVFLSLAFSTVNFLLLPGALASLRSGDNWAGLRFLLYGSLSLVGAALVFAWFLWRHWRASPWLFRVIAIWNMVAPVAAMFVYAAAGARLEGD